MMTLFPDEPDDLMAFGGCWVSHLSAACKSAGGGEKDGSREILKQLGREGSTSRFKRELRNASGEGGRGVLVDDKD